MEQGVYAPSPGNRSYRDTRGPNCTLEDSRTGIRLQKSFTLSVFDHFKSELSTGDGRRGYHIEHTSKRDTILYAASRVEVLQKYWLSMAILSPPVHISAA